MNKHLRLISRFILASVLSSGCAHKVLKAPEGDRLFPYGTYQHQVKIKTIKPVRTTDLRGVVSNRADKIKVVGLSTFGTTVFRIEEDLKTGKINKEFFLEVIQRHEDKLMEFYGIIRELLTAPKGEAEFDRKGAHFTLSELDAQGVYRKIHVEHAQFTVDIEVTDYEF